MSLLKQRQPFNLGADIAQKNELPDLPFDKVRLAESESPRCISCPRL
jgi:hypothetical protein